MGGISTSQGCYKKVIDGRIVVPVEGGEDLRKQLRLHRYNLSFGRKSFLRHSCPLISYFLLFRSYIDTTVVVSRSYNSRVPQLQDVYLIRICVLQPLFLT